MEQTLYFIRGFKYETKSILASFNKGNISWQKHAQLSEGTKLSINGRQSRQC